MYGLRTKARELSEQELADLIQKAVAILVGAAYLMFDQAIAMAMHDAIAAKTVTQGHDASNNTWWLHQRQKELPRVLAEVSQRWVNWAHEAHGNWLWLMVRASNLQQSYETRFGGEAPLRRELRALGVISPRPRPPGRTPFPAEPC